MSRMTKTLAAAVAALLSIALSTCTGLTSANQTGAANAATANKPAYFTGDGGKGRSITILPPQGTGLADNQAYLPDFVANELVSNFNSFSAMTLFDRVNNQKQYDELLSGYYADDDAAGLDLGHLSSTDYMLLGTITRTSSGYALQLAVNSNSDKTTAAAYSAAVAIAELDNLSGVRLASLDLLTKMGVALTDAARNELSGAAAANRVNAQTAVAQGMAAQRQGNIAETMARFYEAASLDPSIAEAVTRANTLSASIRTGSLKENLLDNLALANEWRKLLDDTDRYIGRQADYFDKMKAEQGQLKQGKINYDRATVEYYCDVRVSGVPYPQALVKMRKDVNDGLMAADVRGTFSLIKPIQYWLDQYSGTTIMSCYIYVELLNDTGRVVAQGYKPIPLVFGNDGSSIDRDTVRKRRTWVDGTVIRGGELVFQARFTVKAADLTDQMFSRIAQDPKRRYINHILSLGSWEEGQPPRNY